MNSPKKLAHFFIVWEGGLSKDPNDSASKSPCPTIFKGAHWHTNKGVTYATWKGVFGVDEDQRFLEMNEEDWTTIMKHRYWDAVKGDQLPYQCAADVLTSWAWGSGAGEAGTQLQRMLNRSFNAQLTLDGRIGPKTIEAVAKVEPVDFFKKACEARESFFRYISDEKNGKTTKQKLAFKKNSKFLKGWLNRLNSFQKTFHP
jgi:lysozyme family protein